MIYITNTILLLFLKTGSRLKKVRKIRSRLLSSQRILEKNFAEKKEFFFIQIGANDGISFDFLYDFVIKRSSEGIVIEPVKDYFYELENNYKNFPKIIKINKAIHPFEKKITIHKIAPTAIDKYPDWVKGIASINSEHHKKTNINSSDIITEEVQADTLMNIIGKDYKNSRLDYFQVDTEGFDYEVIKMLDFKTIKPEIIKYESVNLKSEEQEKLLQLLKENGYYTFSEKGDTVGVNIKKIRLLL